jgi:hypothetical protein
MLGSGAYVFVVAQGRLLLQLEQVYNGSLIGPSINLPATAVSVQIEPMNAAQRLDHFGEECEC